MTEEIVGRIENEENLGADLGGNGLCVRNDQSVRVRSRSATGCVPVRGKTARLIAALRRIFQTVTDVLKTPQNNKHDKKN